MKKIRSTKKRPFMQMDFGVGPVRVSTTRPFVRKRSWAELHSFFESTVSGGKQLKTTVSQQIEEYRSWVHIATSQIYRRVGEIEFGFYRSDTDEEIPKSSIAYKTVSKVFTQPNPHMDYRGIKQFWQLQLDLTGMALGWLITDSVFGLPLEVYPLNVNDLVKIHYADDIRGWIKWFEISMGGTHTLFRPENILYFYYPHPADPRQGCSPVKAQAYAVDIDSYIEVYERDFFKNSARFDFAIKYPEEVSLEEDDVDRIKDQWRKKFTGEGHYHELAVLDQGADVVELSAKNEDLALMALAQWSQDKVLAAYSVPPGKVGIVKDVNRANAEGIDITFNRECIKPRLRLHDEVVSRQICRRFDPRIVIKHANPVPRDRELDIKEIEQKVEVPIWTINEGRRRDGLAPVDGGDAVMVPLNYMPLTAGPPVTPVPPDEKTRHSVTIEPVQLAISEPVAAKGSDYEYTDDYLERRWSYFAAYTEGWERIWMAKLDPLWRDQKEQVIQNLEKHGKSIAESSKTAALRQLKDNFQKRWAAVLGKYAGWHIDKVVYDIESNPDALVKLVPIHDPKLAKLVVEGILKDRSVDHMLWLLNKYAISRQEDELSHIMWDWDGEMTAFSKTGRQLHSALVLEVGHQEFVNLGVDMDFNLATPGVTPYLGEKVEAFSNEVLSSQYEALRATLSEGFLAGDTIGRLVDRVHAVYSGLMAGAWQAQRIARTEVIGSTNFAQLNAWTNSGIVERKGWLASRDPRTRGSEPQDVADHLHMDKQIRTVGSLFVDHRTGAKLAHPGDASNGAGPEDIINCRCTMVPYAKK